MLTKMLKGKDFSEILFVCFSTGISVFAMVTKNSAKGSGGELGWLGDM